MPIRFQCEDCHAKIKVPSGAEGRNVKCPRCGAIHRVPKQAVETVGHAASQQREISTSGAAEVEPESALDSLAAASSVETIQLDNPSGLHDSPFDDEDDKFDPDNGTPSPDLSDESPSPDLDDDDPASEENSVDEEGDGDDEDPLAALAAMADTEDEDSQDEDFDFDDEEGQDGDEEDGDDPAQALALQQAAEPAPPHYQIQSLASAPTPALKQAPVIAKPVPKPVAMPISKSQPAPTAEATPRVKPTPQPKPPGAETPAVPSPRPQTARPQAKPIPLGEPSAVPPIPKRVKVKTAISLASLAGWVLRIMAILSVGGTVKLMLVTMDFNWPIGDSFLVLLAGLVIAAVVWGLGEIAIAVGEILRSGPQ